MRGDGKSMKPGKGAGESGRAGNGRAGRRKTVFVRMKKGKGIVVEVDTRMKKPNRKVYDLDRNPQYADWLYRGEACALLGRSPQMFHRYRQRGMVRSVRAYRGDPRRWRLLFHPGDVRELAESLRRKDAVGFQRKNNLDRIADLAYRLPGPEERIQ